LTQTVDIGVFIKLFRTSDMEIIKFYQSAFNFVLPSVQLAKRRGKFVKKINTVSVS